MAINRSFNRLDQAEADAVDAPRLKIVDRGRQSFSSLARQSAIEYDLENILRLLNRAFPDGDISAIERLKTVILDE